MIVSDRLPSSAPRRIVPMLALLLLILCTAAPVHAQHDTKGRVFWVTFMANYGAQGDQETSDLMLYVSSDVPTRVRIVYFGTADTMTIQITQPRASVPVNITARFGPFVELGMGEEFSPKAIQVIADEEITCYGVNIRALSADAFLSLPDDVLTNSYIVLAYPNGYNGGGYDMPSQFAIVGTEDGTTVRIEPSCDIVGRPRGTYSITLDRGEVYNGQARLNSYQDVSGTEIKSNKPVAVYAGVRRTSIPLRVGNFRDHLIEQIPPIEVWGTSAIATPHYPITPQSGDTAVIRVLAAFDNTRWQIDGVEQTPLERAVSVEVPLLQSMYITADRGMFKSWV